MSHQMSHPWHFQWGKWIIDYGIFRLRTTLKRIALGLDARADSAVPRPLGEQLTSHFDLRCNTRGDPRELCIYIYTCMCIYPGSPAHYKERTLTLMTRKYTYLWKNETEKMHVHNCICTYIYMRIHVTTCTLYKYIYINTHTYIYINIYIYIYTYVCIYIYKQTYIVIYAYNYIYIHKYIYIHI